MDDGGFEVDLRIRLKKGGEVIYGKGVAYLLRLCEKHHSLHKAAAEIGMSYRKALFLVSRAEEGFGQKILERSIGGSGGGGSRLTAFGGALVEQFSRAERDVDAFARERLAEALPEVAVVVNMDRNGAMTDAETGA